MFELPVSQIVMSFSFRIFVPYQPPSQKPSFVVGQEIGVKFIGLT